ncbi:efflux RND transporter permease subunit [Paenibacillus thermotolerans]|uniref:efflux RND transporter permease subunit n=1 Tax=Paenibacillus thermotolerans TaxID=3027807 RepID=UPI002367D591|nr:MULTISPECIES: efflux RND transporter permease subunit [unclassified Paenibacillus]
MRGIIRFSLNNKFAIWLLTIIVTVAGLYAGLNMKQETLPNLEVPYLQITAVYPGAAPEEVVANVTKPLEQRLIHMQGVKTVNSTSMENVSAITVEFDYGQDMDKASSEVRETLSGVTLPSGAQKPAVSQISFNAFPVVSLSATDKSMTLEELTKLVEDDVKPSLEGLNGVASVEIAGQYVKEVTLRFNREKMKTLGLSEDTVKGIIQGSAITAPLGLFEIGDTEKTIVVNGGIATLEDLQNLAIPVMPSAPGQQLPGQAAGMPGAPAAGAPAAGAQAQQTQQAPTGAAMPGAAFAAGIPTIPLKDIADIELTGQSESISRTNGTESIGIQIVKAQDANTVDVVNAVKAEAKKLSGKHSGLELITLLDQGEPIEQSVSTMLNKALFGALFAVVVILLFLRNLRTTMISIISIPLSLLIGILVLQQMDITLNMMTLGAMTVAIGRVVDDSIVVIENIYRRMSLSSEKLRGKALVLEATREMFIPILSSTIVTVAVFLPLGTVSGMVGELFMPFALTIVFALAASLLVAITIVPALGHALFRNGVKSGKQHHEDHPGRLARAYKNVLQWSLNHKAVTILLAVILLVGSFALTPFIGVSFLPEEEQKFAMVTYSPAPGERLEDVVDIALKAENFILSSEDVTNMQYSVGGRNPMSPGPSKSALFYVMYRDDVRQFEDVKKQLIEDLKKAAPGGGEWAQMDMTGGFGGNGLALNVYGESIEDIRSAVDQIQSLIEADADFEKADNSFSETYGQYTLVADQQKLSSLGLTAGQIAMALSPVRERPVLTSVEVDGKQYEVHVQVDPKQFASIGDIENTTVVSPLGMAIPLKEVVNVREGESPNTITQKDGRMYAQVTADITAKDVAKASSDLQSQIDKLNLPSAIDVEFGGVSEQINETFTQLGLAMAAAVAIVYFVLVVTFGGALAPFAILFSLPFAIIGALAALFIAGETISVSAMMGALMLIGIVVTNAIVLIDRVIHKEREGLSTREALLDAGGTRLRPILMTALATIGALIPLALGYEGAGIISKGLGVTVIGGLTSSTLLTLVIVPVVYELLSKLRSKRKEELI